ncbi:MAG: extracellular solute-binding protein [Solirubrobacterales bacterium]
MVLEQVPDLEAIEALIPEFEQAYPNVTMNIEQANYEVIQTKEIASFQQDSGTYDLIPVDTAWLPEYVAAGFLEELGPAVACLGDEYDYFDLAKSVREIGVDEGKIYGIPYYSYPTGFVYRKDLWKAPPSTLDQLVSEATRLTKDGQAGIALQPMQGQTILEEWNAYLLASGGELRDPETGEWTIDTPEAEEALETYIDLYKTAAPENSLNWGFDESTRAAASGKATALSTYALLLSSLNEPGSAASGKFALSAFPGGKGTGGSWVWGIPTNSQAKDAAWAWISWITAKQQDTKRTILGGAPIRDSVMEDPEVWEKGIGKDYYLAYQEIAENAVPICVGQGCAEASQKIGEDLNAAVAGSMSVEEALSDAQASAQEATGA